MVLSLLVHKRESNPTNQVITLFSTLRGQNHFHQCSEGGPSIPHMSTSGAGRELMAQLADTEAPTHE